jgi:hypothetical protein
LADGIALPVHPLHLADDLLRLCMTGLGIYCLHHRFVPGSISLSLAMFAIVPFVLGSALELMAMHGPILWIMHCYGYLLITLHVAVLVWLFLKSPRHRGPQPCCWSAALPLP